MILSVADDIVKPDALGRLVDNAMQKIGPIQAKAVVELVYEQLLAGLMSLSIPPNSRMTIDALARDLGVSHTPVREALNRLEAEGLVIKSPNIGYSATPALTADRLDELFELRLLLEPHAAACAATRISDAELRRLSAIAGAMTRRSETGRTDYTRFAKADAELHGIVTGAGGNRLIQDTLVRLRPHFHIFRLLHDTDVTQETVAEHHQIVAALSKRDPVAAKAAMTDHIMASRRRISARASDRGV